MCKIYFINKIENCVQKKLFSYAIKFYIYNYKQIIYSYRIEKALMTNIVNKMTLKDEIIIYKEIILAIDIHRKAIKLVFIYLLIVI